MASSSNAEAHTAVPAAEDEEEAEYMKAKREEYLKAQAAQTAWIDSLMRQSAAAHQPRPIDTYNPAEQAGMRLYGWAQATGAEAAQQAGQAVCPPWIADPEDESLGYREWHFLHPDSKEEEEAHLAEQVARFAWRPTGPYSDFDTSKRDRGAPPPQQCLLTDVLCLMRDARLNVADVDHVRFWAGPEEEAGTVRSNPSSPSGAAVGGSGSGSGSGGVGGGGGGSGSGGATAADPAMPRRPPFECLLTDVLTHMHAAGVGAADVGFVMFNQKDEGQLTWEGFWCTWDEFAAAARGRPYTFHTLCEAFEVVGKDRSWVLAPHKTYINGTVDAPVQRAAGATAAAAPASGRLTSQSGAYFTATEWRLGRCHAWRPSRYRGECVAVHEDAARRAADPTQQAAAEKQLAWCTFDEFAAAARGTPYTLDTLSGLAIVGVPDSNGVTPWLLHVARFEHPGRLQAASEGDAFAPGGAQVVQHSNEHRDWFRRYLWSMRELPTPRPRRHRGACVPVQGVEEAEEGAFLWKGVFSGP